MLDNLFYFIRNICYREIFRAIYQYSNGDMLDVGGGEFYSFIKRKRKFNFKTYTTLEIDLKQAASLENDSCCRLVVGNGCELPFKDNCFDTVLNIQVLEHTFNPMGMINEIARIIKPKGYGVFLIPQTAVTHMAPNHFYNFTRFWILEAMKRADLKILELKPLGGIWLSMASHLFYFFFQSFKFKGMSCPESKRSKMFYLLYPLMVLYALASIPVCLLLSLGDLKEEPNNYLVVVTQDS